MDYRQLGRLGVKVSPLCLGTMNFGWHTDEDTSHAIMDRGLDAGINFFDTANVYGSGGRNRAEGRTEQILGRWFAQGGQRRAKVVLATKVYGKITDWPNFGGLSALHIRQACEDSLRRLQTDHIDLYQMHHVDRSVPWEEIWQAMDRLISDGKVLYVGSSNFAGWHIVKANEAAHDRHMVGLASEQCLYNLTERTVELEILPACQDAGMGVLPWSPLAGGLLGGALRKANEGRRSSGDMSRRVDENRERLESFEKLCADLGEEPANVALAWLLVNPAVTAPIIGPRTVDQLDTTIRAMEIELDDRTRRALDRLFPGPGGPVPEAFAW